MSNNIFREFISVSKKRIYKLLPPKYKWPKPLLKKFIEQVYFQNFGYHLNWNHLELFTEKIQWYKTYYKNDQLKTIIDKASFKSYIEQRLGPGYTIPLLAVWNNTDEFERDWDKLPETFCIKSTICAEAKNIKMIYSKSNTNFAEIKELISHWFEPKNTNLNSTISAYYRCSPRVLAEEYMSQVDGQLYDYKFFCFKGKPYYVYVATDHFPGQISHISFYDLSWNILDIKYGKHQNCNVERPRHFEKMVEIASTLSADFPFVRVDFFDTEDKLFIAEMTFFPGSGFTPYHPESFNRHLGDLFELPIRKKIHKK